MYPSGKKNFLNYLGKKKNLPKISYDFVICQTACPGSLQKLGIL